MQSNVIVALDGTTYAEAILPHALFIAQQTQSQLTLLRVILPPGEPVYPVPYIPDDWYPGELMWTKNYLSSLAARLQAPGVDVHINHADGVSVSTAITDYAEKLPGASVIALASHGRDAAGRFLLGSVAEELLDTASTSLLLMHPPTDSQLLPGPITSASYRAVLVTFEGGTLDEMVLERAVSLAMASHASLHLVGLLTPSEQDDVLVDQVEKPNMGGQTHQQKKQSDSLADRADSLQASTGLIVKTILIDEDPERFIEGYSEQYGQEMLIVAPRGQERRSALRFLEDSNAPALLVNVEASV